MEWKIIRNEQNEIIKYVLTNDIYINRVYCGSFYCDRYYNTLIINGKEIKDTILGSGNTLKDLKRIGEEYYRKENN